MDKRLIQNLIILFIVATTLLVLNGCAGMLSAKKFNTIRLNGYTGGKPPIQTGKKIFVLKDKKATNPLFEDEIAIKIKKVLKIKGFVPIDESHFSDANYIFTFSYGIDSGRERISSSEQEGKTLVQVAVSRPVPIIVPSQPLPSHDHINIYTPSQPRIKSITVYTRTLLLYLYDTVEIVRTDIELEASGNIEDFKKETKPVWIGEVVSEGPSPDLRNVIDYLILFGVAMVGEDKKEINIGFSSNIDDNPPIIKEAIRLLNQPETER